MIYHKLFLLLSTDDEQSFMKDSALFPSLNKPVCPHINSHLISGSEYLSWPLCWNGKEHYQVKETKRRKAPRRLNKPKKHYIGQPSNLSLSVLFLLYEKQWIKKLNTMFNTSILFCCFDKQPLYSNTCFRQSHTFGFWKNINFVNFLPGCIMNLSVYG